MKALFVFLGFLGLTAALNRTVQTADLPEDCTKMFAQSPRAISGVYVIQPPGNQTRMRVYCEKRRWDGYTVIQRRSGALVYFYRTWAEYKNGFGYLTYDHWLGLDKIHKLTKDTNKVWTLRVDLWGHRGEHGFAVYQDFRIGDEESAYRLHIGTYSGTAGDAIHGTDPGADQNGTGFSTIDRKNNNCSPLPLMFRCVIGKVSMDKCSDGGGWWYSNCGSAALNGEWHSARDPYDWYSGIYWLTWMPRRYSAWITRMMIKSD